MAIPHQNSRCSAKSNLAARAASTTPGTPTFSTISSLERPNDAHRLKRAFSRVCQHAECLGIDLSAWLCPLKICFSDRYRIAKLKSPLAACWGVAMRVALREGVLFFVLISSTSAMAEVD